MTDVAWSPDGTGIASASIENTVIVWDVAKGKRKVRSPFSLTCKFIFVACEVTVAPRSMSLCRGDKCAHNSISSIANTCTILSLSRLLAATAHCAALPHTLHAGHAEDLWWPQALRARRGMGPLG